MSTSQPWSTTELAHLRQHYPEGGIRAVAPLLPGRSYAAIFTKEELQLLVDTAHLSPKVAAARFKKHGFVRSETGIHVKRKRLKVKPSDNGYYNASQLAMLLGVDPSTVANWCERGWLKAKRRGTNRTQPQGGDQWWIREADVRTFAVHHPMRIDHRKLPPSSWAWFVELLVGRARI